MENADKERRELEAAIDRLHRYYREGRLRILVGAGISAKSGLPLWKDLILALLEATLSKAGTRPENKSWRQLATDVFDALGNDAAADLVWQQEDPARDGAFFEMLAASLYPQRDASELRVPDVAYQIAAMARSADIYTTNYDPLLELAISLLQSGDEHADWKRYRARDEALRVRHVHGWVDPDGHWGGSFVLTESHYIALQNAGSAPPNRDFAELLDSDCAVLIIGMSLADPNLRRLLWHRALSPLAIAPVYAVMKAHDLDTDGHQRAFWKTRKTTLLRVSEYDQIQEVLRNVQFGTAAGDERPPWLARAARALPETNVFETKWQRAAWQKMRIVRDLLPAPEEEVQLSLFQLSVHRTDIWKIVGTRSDAPWTGDEAQAHAEKRRLTIKRGKEQGLAGLAVSTGLEAESSSVSQVNLNFTPDMMASWDRDFAFLLALPIFARQPAREHGDGAWLCVGAIVATSSDAKPAWRQDPVKLEELLALGRALLLA